MTSLLHKTNVAPAAAKKAALPLLVLALAVLVYGLHGFDGILLRDYSIYLYGGQRVAEGIPPYAGVFDHKGPLSPMIAGLGVALAAPLGWDDVYAARAVFFAAACLAAVAVYLLGESAFRSRAAGLFAALTFLGFYAYAQAAGSGPEPKTPMVLFEALSLWLTVRKRWFWAGVCGSLALLVWQPMAIFAFVTLVLAVTRPREERYGATLRALAGVAAPLVAIVAYFYYHGALQDLLDGFFLFNVLHLVRGPTPLVPHLANAAGVVALTYTVALIPIFVGLVAILGLYFKRPYEYRHAPILLSFPAPVLWSLRDFQLADDFYVFLPYAAVGFGAVLAFAVRRAGSSRRLVGASLGALLLALALANTSDWVSARSEYALTGTTIGLPEQRAGAQEIREKLGEDATLASINSPQVMVLLEQTNPNPYLWITAGVDREIAARTPGGFEGWLQDLETSGVDAISFFGDGQTLMPSSHLTDTHRQELGSWLEPRFHAEKIGPFWLFLKDSPTNNTNHQASNTASQQEEAASTTAG